MLRSAGLIKKLVTLMYNLKVDVVGNQDTATNRTCQPLWSSMQNFSLQISDTDAQYDFPSAPDKHSESSDEDTLCVAFCKLLVPAMRQGTKQTTGKMQRIASLELLAMAARVMKPMLRASELGKLGKTLPTTNLSMSLSLCCFHELLFLALVI